MNEEKTTIRREIDKILLAITKHILFCGFGCFCTYLGVVAILDVILDKTNQFETILCIPLGIIMTLFGIFFTLGNFFLLLGVRRYCSKFVKTEITIEE